MGILWVLQMLQRRAKLCKGSVTLSAHVRVVCKHGRKVFLSPTILAYCVVDLPFSVVSALAHCPADVHEMALATRRAAKAVAWTQAVDGSAPESPWRSLASRPSPHPHTQAWKSSCTRSGSSPESDLVCHWDKRSI